MGRELDSAFCPIISVNLLFVVSKVECGVAEPQNRPFLGSQYCADRWDFMSEKDGVLLRCSRDCIPAPFGPIFAALWNARFSAFGTDARKGFAALFYFNPGLLGLCMKPSVYYRGEKQSVRQ
jgi:hypothetical protein